MPELGFRRVAILGTGLIGGSFGLALRRAYPHATVVGWDRPEIAERAHAIGAVSEVSSDALEVLYHADLVYIALPIGPTLELLPAIASSVQPNALVTDAASTKTVICRVAEKAFRERGRFLGGHPVAGREVSGIENASADLFSGARYALIVSEDDGDARVKHFVELVRAIGAQPLFFDAETHDWAAGIISHLPQLVAVALARVVLDETDETGLPASLAGRGLRDATRLAGSPYDVWRDICLTNGDNIARALDRVSQAIDHLRTHLASKDLEDEFRAANELYKILHNLQ
ncbi:MAG: prephenate dehydrogenase/arogenate dehydrogenase family protein [Candidatus Acidiferrales bacterium]|jgi:prephenate dehydrogenase